MKNVMIPLLAVAIYLLAPVSGAAETAKVFPIDASTLVVTTNVSFKKQIERHSEILTQLKDALAAVGREKESAKKNNSLSEYLAAEEDEKNAIHFLAPYAVAANKSDSLKEQGYALKAIGDDDTTGEVCRGDQCAQVDPITALIMILTAGIVDELNKDKPFGPNNELVKAGQALSKFINKPLGHEGNTLYDIREAMLFHDKNGEISKLVRDPIQRPQEIVKKWRDSIIPKKDNGEIAKAIRDPIKCTIGKLFKKC